MVERAGRWSGIGCDSEPLNGLPGDIGNELKVFVEMQDGEPGRFSGCSDEEVRYRRGTMLAKLGKCELDCDRTVLDLQGEVLDGH